MELYNLEKIKDKKSKRIGRGESSGKGKTSGRGHKGQKQREKITPGFEGGQLPIYRRLPHRRGIGNIRTTKRVTITTQQLNRLPSGLDVNEESLKEFGFIPKTSNNMRVKIVFSGKLEKKLKIHIPISEKAKKIVEKVGGKVINENPA